MKREPLVIPFYWSKNANENLLSYAKKKHLFAYYKKQFIEDLKQAPDPIVLMEQRLDNIQRVIDLTNNEEDVMYAALQLRAGYLAAKNNPQLPIGFVLQVVGIKPLTDFVIEKNSPRTSKFSQAKGLGMCVHNICIGVALAQMESWLQALIENPQELYRIRFDCGNSTSSATLAKITDIIGVYFPKIKWAKEANTLYDIVRKLRKEGYIHNTDTETASIIFNSVSFANGSTPKFSTILSEVRRQNSRLKRNEPFQFP